MRFGSRSVLMPLCSTALIATLVAADVVTNADRAAAQVQDGEYGLYQPGNSDPVGWARVSGDRTVEWWAYVDSAYSWADDTNTAASPWHLEARYIGPGNFATYPIWKADVLQRAAAQGHTIVFQDHSVAEESVEN